MKEILQQDIVIDNFKTNKTKVFLFLPSPTNQLRAESDDNHLPPNTYFKKKHEQLYLIF